MGTFAQIFQAMARMHLANRSTPMRNDKPAAVFSINVPAEITGLTLPGGIHPTISRREALQVPAVLRARNLIAGTLGSLPHTVHGPDRREIDTTYLLGGNIDPDMPNAVVLSQTYEDLLFEGISWWRVLKIGWHGYPVEARHVPVEAVHVASKGTTAASDWVSPDQMIPEDGQVFIDGIPVSNAEIIRFDSPNPPLLVHGARAIRTALKLDRTAAIYADDPLPQGVFTPKEPIDPAETDVQEMLDKFDSARQTRATAYVGAAMDYKALQWSPEQLQLHSARQHAVLEIARAVGVDPEDLGVSTTSRTYQNGEQRRQDFLNFTLGAYVSAVQDRLSMRDVLPRGYVARIKFAGFLRADTKTRMEAYQIGLQVDAYTSEEIRELEDRPSLTPAEKVESADRRVPSQKEPVVEGSVAASMPDQAVKFQAETIAFDTPIIHATFKVDEEKRTITGLAVPWNEIATSQFAKWRFEPGSLSWGDESRVKLNRDHDHSQSIGKAVRLQNTPQGLSVSFKIARGEEGDRALALAADGVLDGLSIEPEFTENSWTPDPLDKTVRLVKSAVLRAVGLTAMPAFDNARVASVKASKKEIEMAPVAETTEASASGPDLAEFTAGLTESITKAVTDAFEKLPWPQTDDEGRQVVNAGRKVGTGWKVTREAPVYRLDGIGPSFVRDAWNYHNKRDDREGLERIRKYQEQSAEFAAITRTTIPETSPTGYRPELYVGQLPQGRPFVEGVSRGNISDPTPFTVPRFVSATGATADHVEGTNPTEGTFDLENVTVTPGGISGVLKLTRELVDASNPAIDQIALNIMRESYSQQTEAKVYTELNGTNGVGGTITAGFVPSGGQAATTTGQGDELLVGVRTALALYPFRRFAAPNRMHLSQEGTTSFATAIDSTGRPLLPSIGATNAVGVGNAVQQGWFVDGLPAIPTWSMTGNTAGDSDVIMYNSQDIWVWESPLLTFRFEERSGPANIDLALFGYFATRALRPRGLSGIRHTAA